MTEKKLYACGRKARLSDLCFDKGVAEIGGVEAVAPLSFVYEERPKMIEGQKVYGRVKEGIVVVPANFGFLNPSDTPKRGIVPIGLPLINPEEAVQANRNGNWYSPDMEKYASQILNAFKSAVLIDEKDVKNDVLEFMLNNFVSRYTLALYGGEGNSAERERKTQEAGKYIIGQLAKAGKDSVKSQKLYLPSLEAAKEKVIGAQIFSCGLDDGFALGGDGGGLGSADGVFGVCD